MKSCYDSATEREKRLKESSKVKFPPAEPGLHKHITNAEKLARELVIEFRSFAGTGNRNYQKICQIANELDLALSFLNKFKEEKAR